MRSAFDRSVLVGVGLLAVMVLANSGISYWNTRKVRDDGAWAAHAQDVLVALADLQADLHDAEAQQRTYVLIGDAEALAGFRQAQRRAQAELAHITELIADNSEQQQRLAALRPVIGRALEALEASARIRQEQGLEPAREMVAAGASRQVLVDMDRRVDEMQAVEQELLVARAAETREAYTNALFFGAGSAIFGLLAVAAFVLVLRRSARIRAAAALAIQQEREWFRTTLGSIGDAVIATDTAGKVTFLNSVAETLTGWPTAEAVGRPLTEVFHIVNEATRKAVDNPALRALKEGLTIGLANHTVLIARDGTERPIDDSAAPIRDERGRVSGAVLVFRDISERRRADEARTHLAAIVASSEDAIISKTIDGEIRTWNAAAERIFGYSAAEAVGQPITLIIPPDRLDEERDIVARLVRGERIDHFETVRLRKDGCRLDVSLAVSPLRDDEGKIIGASKVARDISERRRAEEALRAEQDRFEFVRRSSGVGFWYCDLPFDVLIWDERVKAHFHLPPAAVVTIETFYARLHPDDRGPTRTAIEHSIAQRTPYDVYYRTVDPATLAENWVRAIGRTIYAADGSPRRFDGVTLDVTAQKRNEDALRASEGRHRFLAALASGTQSLTDPDEIMATAARLLAEHLNVDRCAYARVEDEAVFVITGDYARGVPSIVGRWPVAAFGAECIRCMLANEPFVVADSQADARLAAADLAAYAATCIRAVICVPLHKSGAFTAAMAVHQQTPRQWTPTEIDLVRTVVGQCWEALERAQMSRSLREAEGRLRLMVESATDYAIFSLDRTGRVATWNSGAQRVFGWAEAEIIGQEGAILFTPEDRAAAVPQKEMTKAANEGRAEDERWHIRKDGTRFYASGVMTLIRDGHLSGYVKVCRDDTQRKLGEEQVRRAAEANAKFRTVFEQGMQFAGLLALDGTVVEANRLSLEFCGYRREDVIGKPFWDCGWWNRSPELTELVRQASLEAAAGKPFRTETAYFLADGTERFVDLSLSPVTDEDGRVLFVAPTGTDITARKCAQEALQEENQLVETLNAVGTRLAAELDLARLLQMTTDEATRIVGAAYGAFFYNAIDARGESYTLFTLAGAPRSAFERFPMPRNTAIFEPTFRGLGLVRLDDVTADPRFGQNAPHQGMPTGHLPVRSYLAVPVKSRSGEVLGGLFLGHPEVGVFNERHERLVAGMAAVAAVAVDNARLYEQLRDQDKRKDEFLALLAHELRNPLAPLRNGLQILRLAGGGNDEAAQTRAMMDRQLSHMVRMIDDLLDVSRISRNKLELRRAGVSLAEVIASAVETVRPAMEAARHLLTVALPAEPVFLDADLTRLAQVFGNLLSNSARYTEPGGRITLTAERTGAEVVVRVQDNGLGIPAEFLPRIFDMFSQIDRSMERSTGGLGIGLALVKGLVEMHGGTVEVASAGSRQGSTFAVRLPIMLENAPATAVPSVEHVPLLAGAQRRILVVDDNRDSANSMAIMLTLLGNDVRTAHDGIEAVALAEEFRPHFILMDIGMPRLNGYEATRRIREHSWGRDTAIIALTGWGQEGDKERSREAGCDAHLVKPVNLPELEKLLKELSEE